jgi:hypothetical protein
LHLGLSLNLVCPAAFLLSCDKSPTSSERPNLLALVTAGVTYIADRGYVSLPLYRDIMQARAFFVIRERHNLRYRTLAWLDVKLDGLSSATLLRGCRDEIIQLATAQMQGEQLLGTLVSLLGTPLLHDLPASDP